MGVPKTVHFENLPSSGDSRPCSAECNLVMKYFLASKLELTEFPAHTTLLKHLRGGGAERRRRASAPLYVKNGYGCETQFGLIAT